VQYIITVFLAVLSIAIPQHGVAQMIPDFDHVDFEDQAIPFSLIGVPNDPPPNVVLAITSDPLKVRTGSYALELTYEYNRDASAALLNLSYLLRDLEAISFWIKSEKDANWIVYMLDDDDAGFLSFIDVIGGEWQHVVLLPEDFEPDSMSDNPKPEVDVSRLSGALAMLDTVNKSGTQGETNTVAIDDFVILRSPYEFFNGDYVVDGVVDSIDTPLSIKGDLILRNGGQLDVSASRFQLDGNLLVEDGSVLNFHDGVWNFKAQRPQQYRMDILNGSDLTFIDGSIRLVRPMRGEARGTSRLRIEGVHNRGKVTKAMTFGVWEDSTLELSDADFVGEFIVGHGTHVDVSESDQVALWVVCEGDFGDTVVLPGGAGEDIALWSAPPAWDRDISLTNITRINWLFIVSGGCGLDVEDVELRSVALRYVDLLDRPENLTGLQNNTLYADHCVEHTTGDPGIDFRFCLSNSSVESWNLYTAGAIVLDVTDVTVGEVIAFDDTQLNMSNSTIDGSAGHFGSEDRAVVTFTGGTITTGVRGFGTSQMTIIDSTLEGDILVSESAIITLDNTMHTGGVVISDDGQFIEQ